MPAKNDLSVSSPLAQLAGSRTSVASVATTAGILDAFPLPDGITRPLPENVTVGSDVTQAPAQPVPDPLTRPAPASDAASDHDQVQHQANRKGMQDSSYESKARHEPRPSESRVKLWHLRYGHSYHSSEASDSQQDTSLQGVNTQTYSCAYKTHSVSRSWDAGAPFTFPPILEAAPSLPTWQEHVQSGCRALADKNWTLARLHWVAAASHPWNNELARLLIHLGICKAWFPALTGPDANPSLINPKEILRLTDPVTGIIAEALSDYASKLKSLQKDKEALRCYEMAGELGFKDALLAASQMYFRGSRRVKRDIVKAQRLFKKAGHA